MLFRSWGLDQLLPPGLRLIHGPGCPVCVTAAETLDAALDLAGRREVILCSYGDMLRVPGSAGSSLLTRRAEGAQVRLITSPLQALAIAREEPSREVVLLAVGFETTAPATALLVRHALALGVGNLSLLTALGRVAPAMEVLLRPEPRSGAASPVRGFLAAGHVCGVVGSEALRPLVRRHRLPVVVSGFEPLELMRAILACVRLLEAGTPKLANAYGRVVRPRGNPTARELLAAVFQVVDQPWRGFGVIPAGGLALRPAFAGLDARRRFGLEPAGASGSWPAAADSPYPAAALPAPMAPGGNAAGEPRPCRPAVRAAPGVGIGSAPPDRDGRVDPCIAALILRGLAQPPACAAFAGACTPDHPLGAPMVSEEGACAAYHRHRAPLAMAAAATGR